jgi:hypothetical protein
MAEIYSLTLIGVLLLSWANFKLFLRISIVMIPFLPRFIGFPLSGGSLSCFRIVVLLSFLRLFYEMLRRNDFKLYFSSSTHKNYTLLILIYSIVFAFSSLVNEKLIVFPIIDELLIFSYGVVIAYAIRIGVIKVSDTLASIALGFSLSLVIGGVEIYVKYPVYSLLGNGAIETTRELGDIIVRSGMYRIYGTLDNPVYYGFYLATMFPICLFYISGNYSGKLTFVFSIITAYIIYNTGSRSAILLVAFSLILYVIIKCYNKQNSTAKFLLLLMLSVFIPVIFTYIIREVIELVSSFTSYNDYDSAAVRSLFSRLLQFSKYSSMVENIWYGDGKILSIKQFVAANGAIDNKMIVVFLEAGLLGLIVVLLMAAYLVLALFKSCDVNEFNLVVYLSIISSLIGIIILPSPVSFFYTSILIALIKRPIDHE